jgi:hypothetical protein
LRRRQADRDGNLRRGELTYVGEKQISFTPPAKLAGTPILRCAAHDEAVSCFGRSDDFWVG